MPAPIILSRQKAAQACSAGSREDSPVQEKPGGLWGWGGAGESPSLLSSPGALSHMDRQRGTPPHPGLQLHFQGFWDWKAQLKRILSPPRPPHVCLCVCVSGTSAPLSGSKPSPYCCLPSPKDQQAPSVDLLPSGHFQILLMHQHPWVSQDYVDSRNPWCFSAGLTIPPFIVCAKACGVLLWPF